MLKIDVVTVFPEMIAGAIQYGVLGQALKEQKLLVTAHSPRAFSEDRHRTVDDRPYGGGDGMLMLAEPLSLCLKSLQHKNSKIIYLSPQGSVLTDRKARELSEEEHLILLCGRYAGVDQRVLNQFVDEEISIGDYILSGGELGALVVVDAVARFIPGVLGHADSANSDSFGQGLLEEPHFTRPRKYLNQEVPEILLGGNHKAIANWRASVSALVTLQKRPDLFKLYIEKNRQEQKASAANKNKQDLVTELLKFWTQLSDEDRQVLGLYLEEKDFYV